MAIGVNVTGAAAMASFQEGCTRAFDPEAAYAALTALVAALECPAADMAAEAADNQDGAAIRQAAWLVEFVKAFSNLEN